MLVTRQCDSDHSHWPFSKYDPSRKPPSPPRMSNHYDAAVSVQSEWQGQHHYPSPAGTAFQPQTAPPHNPGEVRGNPLGIHVKEGIDSPQSHNLPSAIVPRETHPSPIANPVEPRDGNHNLKIAGLVQDIPRGIPDVAGRPLGGTGLNPGFATGREPRTSPNPVGLNEKTPSAKSDEEEDFDDDDMLEGEGDQSAQSAAERTAARRKMKRFRLTHQQTRFLMSEFAKQPHPDAAHRERLSREIPGLSPRQVQVWFQNRRAKIKRLNADDRDRMIKMRAVPDDFDNVQALHSQYGAVHALGHPMAPAGDLGQHSYAQHMMRPLMVDVRRPANDHTSPSGLTPGFGSLGFGPSAPMSSPAVMSPISPAHSDRYSYGSPFTTPMNGAARTSHPFSSQNGLESSLDVSRQSPHPLQPPQLRDPISRARSESAQSPLRTSMSWKGDSIDYGSYRGANASPTLDDRNQHMYQPGGLATYDSTPFSSASTQPPSSVGFPSIHPPPAGPRLQTAASLPLNVDPRDQYRTAGSETHSHSPSSQARSISTTAPYSASSYTTSYPSAPLTAPMEYSVPRSSDPKTNLQEPQMSAPIAPPSDFTQAFQGNMGGHDQGRHEDHGHKRKRSLTLPSGATRPLF